MRGAQPGEGEGAGRQGPEAPRPAADAIETNALYRKVSLRLLPLLGACYLAAYVDRVNVGFAKLQMTRELGLSNLAYGLGAGIFFIGYFLFEVPSNLVLHRIGAKVWFARIMISWAALSAATAALGAIHAMFGPVATGYAFVAVRFLLGAAEAGFFPGVLLYLTYWFPPSRRSLALGQFILAQPVAFVLGAPLSGLILQTGGAGAGLQAWQWMFVLEAAPAALLGLLLLGRLDNSVAQARWLTERERGLLARALAEEKPASTALDLRSLAREGAVWRLAGAYFLLVLGAYGLNFWLPSIVRAIAGWRELTVGLLTAAPYAVGAVVMLAVARGALDARHARRRSALLCVLAGAGLATSASFGGQAWLTMGGLTLGVTGYLAANALFWRLPGEIVDGRALAAGLAAVNALGNLGGFVGPYLMGALARGSDLKAGLFVLAAAMVAAGLVLAASGVGAMGRPRVQPGSMRAENV